MPADRLFHPRLGHSERINQLSHLEFRVWTIYALAADDFGVMRCSALTIQAACDALEDTPKADIVEALRRLEDVGLVASFEHQGRLYCCQLDWQNFQRVKYPRDTMQPLPPASLLERCTPMTQKLFQKHTSLRDERRPVVERADNDAPIVGQTLDDHSPTIFHAPENETPTIDEQGQKTLRLTANTNGERLMANEGVQGEPQCDVWLFQVQNGLYPSHRVKRSAIIEQEFERQMRAFPGGPHTGWRVFRDNLAANVDSDEWRRKGMIPWLDKYISDGRWQAQLPHDPPASERLTRKTTTTLSAAAEIQREKSA